MLNLPEQAIVELRSIIENEIGTSSYEELTESDILDIAEFLLETMATALKIRSR